MKLLNDTSYWHEVLKEEITKRGYYPSLSKNTETDLLIVGAGFAGLSAALHYLFDNPSSKVAIVESHLAGFGASGRNAGFVEPHLLAMSWLFENSLPTEGEAKWALSAVIDRAERTLKYLEELGIDYELKHCLGVLNAASLLAEDVLKQLKLKLEENNIQSHWYGKEEAEHKWGVHGHGALGLESRSIHPAKLAIGLAKAVVEKGASLYEGTEIVRLVPSGNKIKATTKSGFEIVADRCVIATNAWATKLNLKSKVIDEGGKVSCTMIASEVLPPEILEKAGTDKDALVAEVITGFSYRRIHNGRILYGGFDDSSTEAISPPTLKNVNNLERSAKKEMPWLKDVKFEMAWSGPIFSPSNDLPTIEASTYLPNTAIITGNGSSGVPWALLSGGLVAGIITSGYEGDAEGERLRHAMNTTKLPIMSLAGIGASAVWYAIRKTVSDL